MRRKKDIFVNYDACKTSPKKSKIPDLLRNPFTYSICTLFCNVLENAIL